MLDPHLLTILMKFSLEVRTVVRDNRGGHPKSMHYFIGQKLHHHHHGCLLDSLGFDPLGKAFCHCDEVSVLPRHAGQVDNVVHEDELEGVDRLVGVQHVVEFLWPITLVIVASLHMKSNILPDSWPPELLSDP